MTGIEFTRSINVSLLLGGLLGFTAIVMGASCDHVVKPHLSPQAFESLSTAIRYQLIHAVVLVAIGFARFANLTRTTQKILGYAAAGFTMGIVLFSGSIYLNIIAHIDWIVHAAPVGGVALMLSWLVLALTSFIYE